MQGPKNYNGSAVTNRAYGTQVNGSAVGNRAYQGREQRRLETEPPERRFPVGAVCNRAYQGREQTSL